MIRVDANSRELFEGHVDEGITFWFSEGKNGAPNVVLYQKWEHRAAGRVYSEVEHAVTGVDFIAYFNGQGWHEDYDVFNITKLNP